MTHFLTRWFRLLRKPKASPRTKRSVSLGVEQLAERLAPSVSTFDPATGLLKIDYEFADSGQRVRVAAACDRTVWINGRRILNPDTNDPVKSTDVREIQVIASQFKDRVDLALVTPSKFTHLDGGISVDGGAGNDWLRGSAFADVLHGGDGADSLIGGRGGDKLFGDADYDALWGQSGDDFLDDGSGQEFTDGGLGYDFNAYVVAINGATYNDVCQGYSPTCWLVAAISSATYRGADLASRIHYLGNGTYEVGIFDVNGVWSSVRVDFGGARVNADAKCNLWEEGESWVLLTQRAYLISRGIPITDPPGGWSGDAFMGLIGHTGDIFPQDDFTTLVAALDAGQNVIASSQCASADLTTGTLVSCHAYTVLGCEATTSSDGTEPAYTIVIRNPWGFDGGSAPTGDTSDGIIRVPWSDFVESMRRITIA